MAANRKYLRNGRLQVTVYLDSSHLEYLQERAQADSISVSAVLRKSLDAAIRRTGAPNAPLPARHPTTDRQVRTEATLAPIPDIA